MDDKPDISREELSDIPSERLLDRVADLANEYGGIQVITELAGRYKSLLDRNEALEKVVEAAIKWRNTPRDTAVRPSSQDYKTDFALCDAVDHYKSLTPADLTKETDDEVEGKEICTHCLKRECECSVQDIHPETSW